MFWFYHERNIDTKMRKGSSYFHIKTELEEFKKKHYEPFKDKQNKISDIKEGDIERKVKILNDYYPMVEDFEQKHKIKSQAKFRSTVLEEFCGYLFKDLPEIKQMDLNFFNKCIFAGLKIDSKGNMKIQTKDVDFCIGKEFKIFIEKKEIGLIIPLVAIECKTYLDNTMFSEGQFTAQKLKNGTPNVKVYIFTERNEVGLNNLPSQSPIDEIFVIRENEPEIDYKTVYDFFRVVQLEIQNAKKENNIKLPGRLLNIKQ